MLKFLHGKYELDTKPPGSALERKLRLFAAGTCRQVWHLYEHEVYRQAVEIAEQFADDEISLSKLTSAYYLLKEDRPYPKDDEAQKAYAAYWDARQCCSSSALSAAKEVLCYPRSCKASIYTDLLRCVMGNPFSVPAWQGAWCTADVNTVARCIYRGRRWSELYVLADALEEAGCTERDILDHLRGPDLHVRGCWVVDLVPGKS
jgi:hypothetical protein